MTTPKIHVIELEEEKKKLPPFTQAYKLILSILKNTKMKQVRRIQVKLTRLIHLEGPMLLKDVRIFSEFVRYHTKSGRLRKTSYRHLLVKGKTALVTLSPKVDKERGKRTNMKKDIKKLDAVEEAAFAPKSEVAIKAKVRVRRKRLDTELKSDDEMFLRAVNQTDSETLGYDEDGFLKRAVVFFNTMIPQQILRQITIEYGIQRIAHYLMASHGKLIGISLTRGETSLSKDQCRKIAEQKVTLRNKTRAKSGLEPMGIFGREVITKTHIFWLLLPKHINDDPNVRIGRWEFSSAPVPKDAQYI